MARLWNPGEPVWDQETGDVVIDPTTGDAVVVSPESIYTDPVTGAQHQTDDVANAVYYRVNTYTGEVLRDASLGVDFHGVVFATPAVEEAIVSEIRATAKTAPGVAALTEGRLVDYDVRTRRVGFVFRVKKRGGNEIAAFAAVSG